MHPQRILASLVTLFSILTLTFAVPVPPRQCQRRNIGGEGDAPDWLLHDDSTSSSSSFNAKLSVLSSSLGFYQRQRSAGRSEIFEARALEDPIFLSVRIGSIVEAGGENVRTLILKYADHLRKHGRISQGLMGGSTSVSITS